MPKPRLPNPATFPTLRRRCSIALAGLLAAPWVLPALAVPASGLADRLRDGQHVLLIRHAYAPGVGDPAGFSLERCDTQRVLNEEGRAQADRIGQWLRAQGLERARVFTSAWCRCRQTAELLGLGAVTVEASLGSFFSQPHLAQGQNRSLQAFVARHLKESRGLPLVLVTHHVNIREFTGQDIGTGDMVLARVDARGRATDLKLFPSP